MKKKEPKPTESRIKDRASPDPCTPPRHLLRRLSHSARFSDDIKLSVLVSFADPAIFSLPVILDRDKEKSDDCLVFLELLIVSFCTSLTNLSLAMAGAKGSNAARMIARQDIVVMPLVGRPLWSSALTFC